MSNHSKVNLDWSNQMLERMFSLKQLRKPINSFMLAMYSQKNHVRDKFQISMNSNSRVKIHHLMQTKWSKTLNQFLRKNIQCLVGSNGIQFKIRPHGTLLSD